MGKITTKEGLLKAQTKIAQQAGKPVRQTLGSKIKNKLYNNLVAPSVNLKKINKAKDDKMAGEAAAGLYN